MANGSKGFDHDGFEERVNAITTLSPMKSAAENILYTSYGTDADNLAQQAITGWINSEGHEKNLRSASTHCAIGVARENNGYWYFTQLFFNGTEVS